MKKLTITWEDETKEPLIILTGNWTMVQVNALQNLIFKAFRKHVMNLKEK